MPITGPDPGCLQAEVRLAVDELPLKLVVAAALVDVDNRVLIGKRPEGKAMAGLWEFPGGKVAEGELPEPEKNRTPTPEVAKVGVLDLYSFHF